MVLYEESLDTRILTQAVEEIAFRAGGVHAGEFPDRWLPSAVAIVDEAFTEQNGLVNSTMKVVRSRVEEHFRDRLDALYTPEGKRPDSAQNLASLKKLVE